MRKAQKEQAEKLVSLLGRVHDGVKMSIEAGQKDQALDYLGQCQSGAISLGEAIEETEGEGFVTVRLLEEYCETVYQIYEKLRQGQSVSAGKAVKSLRRALIPVKNSVQNDIKVRVEAVFLPYKASMWDSLESVWKAAEDDPECDAYVIPIPYYDKNPDGSFREEHYEGDLYPDYVPVTRYQDYDFAERRPDMVFIHNPYDECNYVTSVHPFFYARNLKQYTDKLIYIPYFILGNIDSTNKNALENIEHFCTLPGVLYADRVIVESEAMRQAYIKIMTYYAMEKNEKGYWMKKIQGLGSPKIDKTMCTRKENLNIPEEWMKIILKADGTWKKIIFYNTSVTSLLKFDEKMLDKMEDVFKIFRKNLDIVALLWRPHPLIEATIRSMRPGLWKKYSRIVDIYRNQKWGIYDDTTDLDRAIILSDAYYGDESSVIQLYQIIGKPIMLQNVFVKDCIKVEDIPVYPSDFLIEDNIVWFVHGKISAIFSYDLLTHDFEIVKYIPVENLFEVDNFCNIFKSDEKIFLVPGWARKIYIYDLLNDRLDEIPLQDIEKMKGKFLFRHIMCVDDELYCIPYQYHSIIKINVRSLEYVYITLLFEENVTVANMVFVEKNKMIGVWKDTNKVFMYDVLLEKITHIYVADEERKFYDIQVMGERIYILDSCHYELLNLKLDSGTFSCIANTNHILFSLSVINDNRLLLDGINDNEIIILNDDGSLNYNGRKNKLIKKNGLNYPYSHGIYHKFKDVFYFDRVSCDLYRICNNKYKIYRFLFSKEQINDLKIISKTYLNNTLINNETELRGIPELILSNGQYREKNILYKKCGMHIWTRMKNIL